MAAGVTSSLAQMVVDNDIAASVRRVIKGFEVNDDSLAVDVIHDAMNGQHNFLAQRHTINYLKGGELLHNILGVRHSFEEWEKSGRIGLAENAHAKAERTLEEHMVPPLEEYQEKELEIIIQKAEDKLVK